MENYVVSARKYRPVTFESVVGQKSITDMLRNAIRTNHLAHAYLFCGPRGVGKTTCARIFAKTINCRNLTADSDACNECESCRAFNSQQSFNYHELDAASNNSVEDIRTLIQEVQIRPQDGKYAVFVIDEVHMLSASAFNALLKTLEEPPAHAVFILATTEKHKVLPTILSRCQVFDFSRITISDIIAHLKYVAKTEGFEAEENALAVVARKADGGMRDALSIFDQLATFCTTDDGKTVITYEKALAVLNVLDTDYYFRLVDYALAGNVGSALLLFNEVLDKGFDAANFLSGFATHLRDLLVSKDPQTVILLETSESIRRQYAAQAANCPAMWLFKALDVVNTAEVNYRTARDRRLTVELMLIRLSNLVSPAPQQPQPATQPQPAPQPKTTAQTPQQPAPTPTQNPTTAAPKAAPAPMTMSASIPGVPIIPGATQPKAESQQPEPEKKEEDKKPQNVPFTEEQMADAWLAMCRKLYGDDKMKYALLSNIVIKKTDDQTYEAALPNKILQEDFQAQSKPIRTFLAEKLHNSNVKVVFTVDTTPDSTAYTADEKLQVLMHMNPLLNELRDDFGLILE